MAVTKRKARAMRVPSRNTAKRRALGKPRTAKRSRPKRTSVKTSSRRARPQTFTASHHREEDFKTGLRAYANYRDLGIADATHGMVRAHVIRFVPPCRPEEVSKRHYHEVDFQMIYVLKGWIKTAFDGEGEMVMRQGSAWIQPPRIRHVVLDYSDDCEVLEIILPADFRTVELE
jgi:hypothetical protein